MFEGFKKVLGFQTTKSISLTELADLNTHSSGAVSEKQALGIPAFWAAVRIISEDVAGCPISVYRTNEETGDRLEHATRHPAYRLVRYQPSSMLDSYSFLSAMVKQALVHGNSYARIHRDSLLRPREIEMLDSGTTFPVIEGQGLQRKVVYTTTHYSPSMAIRAEDIIHIRGLSSDGIIGLSLVEVLNQNLMGSYSLQRYRTRFFESGGAIKGILQFPDEVHADRADEILRGWKRITSGLENSHAVALLSGGAEYKQTTSSARDAMLVESQALTPVDISNATGVRPHMLGSEVNSSYGSMESENHQHARRAIGPWLDRIEAEFSTKLLTEASRVADEFRVRFDRTELTVASLSEKAEANYKLREAGVLTGNEIRESMSLPALPDADSLVMPVNWSSKEERDAAQALAESAQTQEDNNANSNEEE